MADLAWDRDKFLAHYGDKTWRLDNLYTIKDADGKAIPFRMNGAQRALHENRHNRDLILKARQLGFTTYIQLDMLDDCLWYDNQSAGVIAHNRDDAEAFFSDKIKFAYDHLPQWVRERRPNVTDRANELKFSNGSRIRVGTSHRSGTLQYLHVSEFGKLAADRPDLAEEVVTGAFPTVHGHNRIVVESTARGQGGRFHKLCVDAENALKQGRALSPRDFRFHFIPWWRHPGYTSDLPTVLTHADLQYFDRLKAHGIALTEGQRNWYVQTARTLGDQMKQEHPSTSEEAFEASVEGAYYQSAMTKVRTEGRLGAVPFEPLPVNTFWDIGGNDDTAIWFHQQVGLQHRFLAFMAGSGEGAAYWAQECEAWRRKHQLGWGKHYLPHDGATMNTVTRTSWRQELEANGLTDIEIVPRAPSTDAVIDGINECRKVLSSCWFHEAGCGGHSEEAEAATGIECLDNYRKEWDANRSVFKRTPRHDRFSHGADAFRTFAVGWKPVKVARARPRPRVATM